MDEILRKLVGKNRVWARETEVEKPGFLQSLAHGQNPKVLWIGCSDSRVPPDLVLGLEPGEVFIHRNVANCAWNDDPNCQAVVEYAVGSLKVKHIIVCGHTSCGGVTAALDDGPLEGHLENWIERIRDLRRSQIAKLKNFESSGEKANLLAEINVALQVENIRDLPVVKDALSKGRTLEVHGWMFRLPEGIVDDLGL